MVNELKIAQVLSSQSLMDFAHRKLLRASQIFFVNSIWLHVVRRRFVVVASSSLRRIAFAVSRIDAFSCLFCHGLRNSKADEAFG